MKRAATLAEAEEMERIKKDPSIETNDFRIPRLTPKMKLYLKGLDGFKLPSLHMSNKHK